MACLALPPPSFFPFRLCRNGCAIARRDTASSFRGLFAAHHPCFLGWGSSTLQAHLVRKPYRLARSAVSHKTCEFRVCPVHRLSPFAVCDSLDPIARYTVLSNRFRILAMQRRNHAREKSTRPSAAGTFRRANGSARRRGSLWHVHAFPT